jgi:hypothetical protein
MREPTEALCELCGNPMPPGEEVLKFHGYSCNCPPKCPPCPDGRKPHRDRVREISAMMVEGQMAGIAIDNTPEHIEWYLHELTKYPRLTVRYRGALGDGVYIIKVQQGPRSN